MEYDKIEGRGCGKEEDKGSKHKLRKEKEKEGDTNEGKGSSGKLLSFLFYKATHKTQDAIMQYSYMH